MSKINKKEGLMIFLKKGIQTSSIQNFNCEPSDSHTESQQSPFGVLLFQMVTKSFFMIFATFYEFYFVKEFINDTNNF